MFSRMYLAVGLLAACSTVAVASTAIGTASARGSMLVDGYAITGNATLFDGTAVQTASAMATLRLDKGTEIRLGSSSVGMLYRDHMVLQQGKTEVATSNAFRLEASGFQVVPLAGNARAVVAVTGLGKMQVSSVAGAFKVIGNRGNVVGTVSAGKALSFAMQTGSATLTGKLSKSNGKYYVTDANGTHEIVGRDVDKEAANKGFDQYIGKQVNVTGTQNGDVFEVSTISKVAGGTGGAFSGESGLAIAEGTAAAGFLGWGIYEAGSNNASR